MLVYRISKSEYIEDLSGTGAKLFGGRWNNRGTALLYCSENISLAILEIMVHFDGLTVPDDLAILELEIDEQLIDNYPLNKFDKIRRLKDAEFKFKIEGQKWIESKKSLGLRVPSIINEYEFNILVNPFHTNFHTVKINKVKILELDSRLFK